MPIRSWMLLVFAIALRSAAAAQCLGDFNGDGRVDVDELITAVNNSLHGCAATRFSDNGDGTITDNATGLMWEKKHNLDGAMNAADPHDADNVYELSEGQYEPNGTAYTEFLPALSHGSVDRGGCFADHCDWRLPTKSELQSIVDLTQGQCGGGSGPCIDPVFGPTQDDLYWSNTTVERNSVQAWYVSFFGGGSMGDFATKNQTFGIRAVRGGF